MKKRNSPKSSIPIFLVLGGLLLLVAAVFLAIKNSNTTPIPAPEEETHSEIQRVSIEDTKAALDAGTALVVDVRSSEAYESSHIEGAINIPLTEVESRLGELERAEWIITYCT